MLIKKGSKGNEGKEIQKALGLNADGIFGAYTEAAVKKYQRLQGLKDDGIVGPKTYKKLKGENLDANTERFG